MKHRMAIIVHVYFDAEMVVSRVEGVLLKDDPIIEGKNQEVTFDVGIEINKQSTSRNVNGENLWSMGAWISKNFDGTGSRLFYNENVLSQEQQDSSFSKPNYPPWQFANLTLDLQGRRRGLCEDFKYLCVKFNKGDEIQTEFNLDFSFGPQNGDDTRLVACALLPECKGEVNRYTSTLSISDCLFDCPVIVHQCSLCVRAYESQSLCLPVYRVQLMWNRKRL